MHFAQGKTSLYAIEVFPSGHRYLTNQKILNVMISRAAHYLKLFTDDKENLIAHLFSNTGHRQAATEHQELDYSKRYKNPQAIKPLSPADKAIPSQSNGDKKSAPKPQDLSAAKQKKLSSPVIKPNTPKQQKPTYVKKEYTDNYKLSDIYQHLYHRLPSLLPEFGFVQRGSHYISTTPQRIDGSNGYSKGKVYVYANNPGMLKDYSRASISIWEYISRNSSTTSKQEIFKYLKAQAGLGSGDSKAKYTPPPPVTPPEVPKQSVDHALLAAIHAHAQESLFKENNKVLSYLQQERGYTIEAIKKMELGFMANKQALGQYLKKLGWNGDKIKQAYKMLALIGKTHHLTIPFKDVEGKMIGLAGRNIAHSNQSPYGKYMYTAGLARSNTLFNIHNMKPGSEAVLVEGMLDCLHAHAKGIANVVALGGTACNQNQLKQLESLGVKQITLCLDNDHAGREATSKVIEQLSKAGSSIATKVATLPQFIKDPDQMLHEKGVEAFKAVLVNAKVVEFKSNYATLAQNISNTGTCTLNSSAIRDRINVKEVSNEM